MNLKNVFWDYSDFQDEQNLIKFLNNNRNNEKVYLWILSRFLERASVADTLKIFTISEIEEFIDKVKISPKARKKWKRIIQLKK
ncbi:MAG: hypothetical protein ABIL76_04485 [candidate division WOR-3 bacterium]